MGGCTDGENDPVDDHKSILAMDTNREWNCNIATDDLAFHACRLGVIYMSGCLYVDDIFLAPIREVTVTVAEGNDRQGEACVF